MAGSRNTWLRSKLSDQALITAEAKLEESLVRLVGDWIGASRAVGYHRLRMVFVDVVYNDVVKVHILSRFLYLISEKKQSLTILHLTLLKKLITQKDLYMIVWTLKCLFDM